MLLVKGEQSVRTEVLWGQQPQRRISMLLPPGLWAELEADKFAFAVGPLPFLTS